MPEKYKNFIDGKWVESASGETFESRSPANKNDIVGICQKSNGEDVDRAVKAAAKALDAWKHTPAPARGALILKIHNILTERKEEIAKLATREMGKILMETRGDVQESIDTAFYMAGEGRRLFGQTTTSELRNKFCMSVRRPLGICGIISPWNFPTAIPFWKMMPALICGDTIVFKPSSESPVTAAKLVEIMEEAGLPKGVVNFVTGSGSGAGMNIVNHPEVQLISFTGSSETGSVIGEICGKTHKRLSLEMGGKNAQIIMDDANIDLAIEGATWGAFGTTGQRCTATSRLIVHKKVLAEVEDKMVKRANALKLGDGLNESTQVGPLISEKQRQKVAKYVKIAKDEGAKLLCGGEPATGKGLDNGWFFQPTIFTNCKSKMRIAQEEVFGPVLAVIPVESFEEAIKTINDSAYGLSSSIYTNDNNKAFKAIEDIYTGITYVNVPTIGAETHLPFGGTRATGNGHRESGTEVLNTYSEWKSVYIDYSGKLQKAQMDTEYLDK